MPFNVVSNIFLAFMFDYSALIAIFFAAVAYNLPMAAISITGIVFILRRQTQISQRHKNFALLGFGVILVLAILGPIIHTAQQLWFFSSRDAAAFGVVSWVSGLAFTLIHAFGYGCLLIALLPPKPRLPKY
jgi:hypothetical protein